MPGSEPVEGELRDGAARETLDLSNRIRVQCAPAGGAGTDARVVLDYLEVRVGYVFR